MRNLYYYNWQLQETVFGVVMDDIKERYEQDDIYFVSCKGSLLPCWSNKVADPLKCQICKFNQKSAFSTDFKHVKQLYIDDFATHEEVNNEFEVSGLANYNTVSDIRKLNYKEIPIGYGALSSYISSTRNCDPLVDSEFKQYFDKLLKTEIFIKIAIDRIIDQIKPNIITIFNGRVHDTRPVYQTAINKGINLRAVETVVKGELDYQRTIFYNSHPLDINFQTEQIEETWEKSFHSKDEKYSIGSQFYKNRRNSVLTRDIRVYTENQKKGLLPENWNNLNRNITIFISSEDEFSVVDKNWDILSIFKDQEAGVRYILKNACTPDLHFYLRIHPNLKDILYGYHTRLLQLDKEYSNVTVIPSNSAVSSYTLMDKSEKIIVFGSTTGIEATYAEKPVILLRGSFYYHIDAAYIPQSKENLLDLINSNLKPKPKLSAIKYGYYLMHIDAYSKPIAYNAKPIIIMGKLIGYVFPHLKVLGSSYLQKIILLLIRLKYRLESLLKKPNLMTIPTKEQ